MAIQAEKMPFDPADDIRKYGAVPGDTPAKPRAVRSTTTKTPVADQPTMAEVRQSLEDLYTLAGSLLSAYPNPRLAMVGASISTNAEKCAESIIEAAKKDPKLKRALIKMTTAGAYSGIFMAHMPIIMAGYVAIKAPNAAFETPETTIDETPIHNAGPSPFGNGLA